MEPPSWGSAGHTWWMAPYNYREIECYFKTKYSAFFNDRAFNFILVLSKLIQNASAMKFLHWCIIGI